jgi:hypothetical protein
LECFSLLTEGLLVEPLLWLVLVVSNVGWLCAYWRVRGADLRRRAVRRQGILELKAALGCEERESRVLDIPVRYGC